MSDHIIIEDLPAGATHAAALFFYEYLPKIVTILDGGASNLAITLPLAPVDHDDWRRAVARDLARQYAPQRVNVIGTGNNTRDGMLAYLRDAQGVTGQYLSAHD